MRRKNRKVICYSCGEKIDSDLATDTDQGYICDECYIQLGGEGEEEYAEDEYEDDELDFYDELDLDNDEDEDYDEFDFYDNDLDTN